MDTNRSSANGDGAANRNEHAGIGDNTAENIYAQGKMITDCYFIFSILVESVLLFFL